MLMAASRPRFELPRRIVLMGVAGCGKSTVGAALAERLGAGYLDGDDLHSQASIDKMTRGVPLTDEDRWPWLTRVGQSLGSATLTRIVGCSALKRVYREHITKTAGGGVTFVHLSGSRAVIETRMKARTGHFMPTGLLDSQFAALETPGADETAIGVDIDRTLDAIVDAILAKLEGIDA